MVKFPNGKLCNVILFMFINKGKILNIYVFIRKYLS